MKNTPTYYRSSSLITCSHPEECAISLICISFPFLVRLTFACMNEHATVSNEYQQPAVDFSQIPRRLCDISSNRFKVHSKIKFQMTFSSENQITLGSCILFTSIAFPLIELNRQQIPINSTSSTFAINRFEIIQMDITTFCETAINQKPHTYTKWFR